MERELGGECLWYNSFFFFIIPVQCVVLILMFREDEDERKNEIRGERKGKRDGGMRKAWSFGGGR